MENRKLHIVALDVPYPADYGGAIDMFYRLKALKESGVEVTLHTFEYGRGRQEELEKYAKVIYYKRKLGFFSQLSIRPYIVQSRKNKQLLNNLLKDNYPILFEGLHTTWYLENQQIQKRLTFVRMHNLEHEYYRGLNKNASLMKKIYFRIESEKLRNYQKILKHCTHILAIKEEDAIKLRKLNPCVSILPASIPERNGSYGPVSRFALFHGNLSVPENQKAVNWLINTLQPVMDSNFDFIVAGKKPGKKLSEQCKKADVKLIANPSDSTLNKLIQEAAIHVLYTSVPSGIKLKLLSCLRSPGHILLNDKMLGNKMFEKFCVVANSQKEFKMHYLGLQNKILSQQEFNDRIQFLEEHFNNRRNCGIILKLMDMDSEPEE